VTYESTNVGRHPVAATRVGRTEREQEQAHTEPVGCTLGFRSSPAVQRGERADKAPPIGPAPDQGGVAPSAAARCQSPTETEARSFQSAYLPQATVTHELNLASEFADSFLLTKPTACRSMWTAIPTAAVRGLRWPRAGCDSNYTFHSLLDSLGEGA